MHADLILVEENMVSAPLALIPFRSFESRSLLSIYIYKFSDYWQYQFQVFVFFTAPYDLWPRRWDMAILPHHTLKLQRLKSRMLWREKMLIYQLIGHKSQNDNHIDLLRLKDWRKGSGLTFLNVSKICTSQ